MFLFTSKPAEYSKITKFKQSLHIRSKREGPATLKVDKKYYDAVRGLKGGCIVGVEVPYNRAFDGSYKREKAVKTE